MSIETVSTGDFAAITSSFPNKVGPLTVMGWFYMVSGPGSGNTRSMVTLADTGNDDAWDLEMKANVGDTIDTFGSYSSGGGDQIGATTISKSAWHNLAITISAGNVLKTYVDGTIDVSAGTHSTSITPTSLRLGASSAGDATWTGLRFYALKIWNAELSGAEITAEQASYSPVRATNLYDYWELPNVTTLTGVNGHNFTRNGTDFQNAADPPPLAGGVTVTAPKGTATGSGLTPATSAAASLAVPAGTATGLGRTPSLASATGIASPAGTATATGLTPSVLSGTIVVAPAATASGAGVTPSVSVGVLILVPLGAAAAAGITPSVSSTGMVTVTVPLGSASAVGLMPVVDDGTILPEQAEVRIILAAYKLISEDPDLNAQFPSGFVLLEQNARPNSFRAGQFVVGAYSGRPNYLPSDTDEIHVEMQYCPILISEETTRDTDLIATRLYMQIRKLLFSTMMNESGALVDAQGTAADAVIDYTWKTTVYPMDPGGRSTGTRIPVFSAIYTKKISPSTNEAV